MYRASRAIGFCLDLVKSREKIDILGTVRFFPPQFPSIFHQIRDTTRAQLRDSPCIRADCVTESRDRA